MPQGDPCEAQGIPMPEHLWVQADNTPSQAKNSTVLEYLSVLVRRHKFRTVTLNFLQVGHTHEDIDQLFGILLAMVLRRFVIKTPQARDNNRVNYLVDSQQPVISDQ